MTPDAGALERVAGGDLRGGMAWFVRREGHRLVVNGRQFVVNGMNRCGGRCRGGEGGLLQHAWCCCGVSSGRLPCAANLWQLAGCVGMHPCKSTVPTAAAGCTTHVHHDGVIH